MLVRVYSSEREDSAQTLIFETPPEVGDQVELDDAMFQVAMAWHQPGDQWSAVKWAISLGDRTELRSPRGPRTDGF